MKIKEIIRTNKGGRMETEKENDRNATTTVVISSLNYDSDDDMGPASKLGRNSAAAIYSEEAIDDDIVYLRNKKNHQYNVAFNDDYRYFGRTSMMDNATFLLSDKQCNCGSPNYNTKKTMLLNDFWEWSHTKFKPASVQRYLINEPAVVNRLISEAANAGCRLNSNTTNTVVENNPDNGLSTMAEKSCSTVSQSQSVCFGSSALLTDKRLVGLFRSVALYWFFCLNTVLAKGDNVFKRKSPGSPLDGGITEQLLHNDTSQASLQNNLQLQICCPDVVLKASGVDLNNDFLWDLAAEGNAASNLLTWAEHSKARLFNDLFEKVLRDLANNCGIFKAIKPRTAASKRREKTKQAAEEKFKADVEERRRIQPSPLPMSPKKSKSGKKIGVRRKYIIDVLDYYYDDDESDTEVMARVPRKTTAVVNRIIWKKRAVKNKLKSKRKMAGAGEHQRVQQIIIECYGSSGAGYVINDGYEEVVGTSEKIESPAAPRPAVAIDDELFIDFDSYAENLKREVAMRQQRRKNQVPAVKIIEPSKVTSATSTEDESGGSGSTNSSLLLELEEESSYFLPDGRYHSATQKYPKYDLWCSPLVVEKTWPAPEPKGAANQTGGRSFKPAPPAAPAFKPYRLWESSWAPEDDFIPSFVAARRRSPKYASMVTMTGPAAAKTTRRRPTFKEPVAAGHQSMYTLWGSPNIIDFLPGIGVGSGSSAGGSTNSVHMNDTSCSSSCGTSSCSPEQSSMEYEEYTAPPDTYHILKTTAAAMHDQRRDAFANHNSFNVRAGKFLNLKPIINGFVSFTDRGAFQYYKKPAIKAAPAMISLALRSRQIDDEVSEVSVSDAAATDSSDVDVKSIAMTPTRSEFDTPFHFKPIQPAFKVPTDTPASFERSESGTLWCNKQKLMTFKHELEEQQRPRSRDSVHELDSFQPKFVVSGNDVGCQTEWYGYNGYENTATPMGTQSYFTPANEKKNGQDPSYVSGAALFYAWDEVFNFLNKPGLGNIDVKAHLDFSCFF